MVLSSKRFEFYSFKITGCISRTAVKENLHLASFIKNKINYKQNIFEIIKVVLF